MRRGGGGQERPVHQCKSKSPPVIDSLPPVYPQPGELGENVDHTESLEVVDEDVWHP